MTDRQLRNLVALARAVGYIQYFYPDLGTTATNWHAFLVEGIPAISQCSTDRSLQRALSSLFAPIAGEASFVLGSADVRSDHTEDYRVGLAGYHWEHRSLGGDKRGLGVIKLMLRMAGIKYQSTLQYADSAALHAVYRGVEGEKVMLTDSLALRFPLVRHRRTLRRPVIFEAERKRTGWPL